MPKKDLDFRLMLYPVNFETSSRFYKNTLKFPVVHHWSRAGNDKGILFQAGSGIIELLQSSKQQPIAGCKISIEVPDVDFLFKKIHKRTIIVFAPRDNPWGDRSFCIKDPQGLHLIFFTKKPLSRF